jgi:membrane-associated phospholipid phosphatase
MGSGPGEAVRASAIITPTRTTRTWTRSAAMVAFSGLLLVWIRTLGIPSDAVQIFIWLWMGTIAWNVEAPPRQHLGFLRDWWVPLGALVVYFYSRGLADEVFRVPVHVQMPISVDLWLGGGELPSYRLQNALCGEPCDPHSDPRWFDLVFASVYTTHFFGGLVLAVVLWMRSRGEWIKWMRRFVGANLAALVVYIVYPMAPPWMASDEGYLSHEVFRITSRGWHDVGLGRLHLVLQGVGNPVAAMPSLHAGIAFLIAMYGIQRLRTPLRFLLLAYPAAMSFALVYFGEHYVVDILAGVALAGFVLAACSWWEKIGGD